MAQHTDRDAPPPGMKPGGRKRIDPSAEPANSPDDPNLWERLLRHGVIQCALAYVVLGWLIIQVVDTTFDHLERQSRRKSPVYGHFV